MSWRHASCCVIAKLSLRVNSICSPLSMIPFIVRGCFIIQVDCWFAADDFAASQTHRGCVKRLSRDRVLLLNKFPGLSARYTLPWLFDSQMKKPQILTFRVAKEGADALISDDQSSSSPCPTAFQLSTNSKVRPHLAEWKEEKQLEALYTRGTIRTLGLHCGGSQWWELVLALSWTSMTRRDKNATRDACHQASHFLKQPSDPTRAHCIAFSHWL